jgi:UDP-glucose:(glucosyl)LPS alpha-1,2-glucosyltransferase
MKSSTTKASDAFILAKASVYDCHRDSSVIQSQAAPDDPLVAVVLPPREGFGPGRAGAIGLIAHRRLITPGFRSIVVGGPQSGAPYPGVTFQPIRPAFWPPGSTNIRFAAAAASWLRRVAPDLVEVHNRPEVALRLARDLPHVPVTLLLNNDPQEMRQARSAAERTIMMADLAMVMTSSDYLRGRFLEGTNAQPESVAVLHNCIDLSAVTQLPKEPLILFVGRVVAEKGTDVFVAACATALPQLPGWRAEIIGADRFNKDSPVTDFVRGVDATARTAGVTMAGYLDHPGVLDAMARAAIVVVPSRWPEPFGITALEALACGAALVVSPRGGLPEVAGDAAAYIDPDDANSIAQAILRLAQDPAARAALGEAGRQRARQFDLPVVAARLATLRHEAMARS